MNINFKPLKRLVAAFKAVLATHVAPEDKDLVQRLTERSMNTTQTGLGGYRVDASIDDWKKVNEELDMAKKIVQNENKTLSKDEIFKQALLVLLKSVEVKTVKIDRLIEDLEKM